MSKLNSFLLGGVSIVSIQVVDFLQAAGYVQLLLQLTIAIVTLYKILKPKKPNHPKNPYSS